jgi:hypothetical protein
MRKRMMLWKSKLPELKRQSRNFDFYRLPSSSTIDSGWSIRRWRIGLLQNSYKSESDEITRIKGIEEKIDSRKSPNAMQKRTPKPKENKLSHYCHPPAYIQMCICKPALTSSAAANLQIT